MPIVTISIALRPRSAEKQGSPQKTLTFGPLSHIYVRLNRPGPARYQTWDCAWMLDPAEAGGGCLRNLGPHGLDSPDR